MRPARSLRRGAATEGAYNLQEDNPDHAEESDKPSVTSNLSEAEQLTGSWWSAKVKYHSQVDRGMLLDMAAGLVAHDDFLYSMMRGPCCLSCFASYAAVQVSLHHVPEAELAALKQC